jgi:hypothetical protein
MSDNREPLKFTLSEIIEMVACTGIWIIVIILLAKL